MLVAPLHQCHEKVKLGAHDTMSLTTDDSSAQVETLEKKEVIGKGREEKILERLTGIEPAPKAWEAFVLPLN